MQEFALLAFIMVLALGAYWAMIIFPKQRDFQKRQNYVRSLHTGDEVITYGGIVGRIQSLEPDKGIAYIEVSPDVTVRIITAALVQPYDPEAFATFTRTSFEEEVQTDPKN